MATNWSQRTVVDLRAELKKRGLPTTGKKADLVERLTIAEAEVEQAEAAQSEQSEQSDDAGVLNTENQDAPPIDAPAEQETNPALEPRAESPRETITKSPSPSPSPAPATIPAQEGRDTDLSAQPPTTDTCPDGKRIIPFFYFIPITVFLTKPTSQLQSSRLSSPRMRVAGSGDLEAHLSPTTNPRASEPGPATRTMQGTVKSRTEPPWPGRR